MIIVLLAIRGDVVSTVYTDYVNNTQDNCYSVLASNLVAYWNFNEGSGDIVHDSSGNGNDGYIYNSYWISWVIGIMNHGGDINPISELTVEDWIGRIRFFQYIYSP